MKLLEGKVAIITGASRGKGIAEVFAKHGANVALHIVHLLSLLFRNELNALGIKAKGYQSMLPILMKHKLWLMQY
jgi:NAD(P)-dependent dehydrogenase (short-subunit alcohol dehydrogenase family)